MSPATRYAKKHAKARKRRYLKAQERLERDCHQAQHAAKVLEQALHDLGLPDNLSRSPHWVWVAIEPVTKLLVALDVSERTQAMGFSVL
jgi:hypothetical protein